jgi:hypothetical protein
MAKMYMIIKHIKVLKDPKKPAQGFMDNESFHITKNPKKRDYEEASIILDVANQKIVKNRFSERSFDDLFKYMSTHYSEYINKWINAQESP